MSLSATRNFNITVLYDAIRRNIAKNVHNRVKSTAETLIGAISI